MNLLKKSLLVGAGSAVSLLGIPQSGAMAATYAHVLVISIDGMHALDLANYTGAHPDGALASLMRTGVFYPNAMTSAPSDSFPGLAALVTGGSPKSTGVFYDDSFDRTYFPQGSKCQGEPGTEVAFAESIDVDPDRLDGGGTIGDYKTQIDPAKLPLALVGGKCTPVYPHDFVRVNNIFEVVKKHGGRTAWSDKHPAYEWLNGPSGEGLDDLYALEQDSRIPGTKVKTTGSFKAERDFDEVRVKAILNEISGMDSTGGHPAPVPALFGMNMQAVSVGQKLRKAGPGDAPDLVGGYLDASGSPGNALAAQLDYVDGALGELMSGLRAKHLEDSTLVILASKHGQSPIDPATLQAIDDDPYTKTPGYAFHVADDAALIWLQPKDREKNLAAAQAFLEKSSKALGMGQILTPNAMATFYNDPARDSRTPDFMVGVNPGVVYTSGSKIAEHGGFNFNDRSVALLVSAPGLKPGTVSATVQTTQVAPTVLRALGYEPAELQAVTIEGTQPLPGLPF